jgi:hypothetical protein
MDPIFAKASLRGAFAHDAMLLKSGGSGGSPEYAKRFEIGLPALWKKLWISFANCMKKFRFLLLPRLVPFC